MIKNTLCIIVCLHLLNTSCFSQGVFNKGIYSASFSVKDCFNSKKYTAGFKADSINPNHIFKGQRIWRTISLENKDNQMILNSGGTCTQINLFEVIKFGLIEKKLNAFASDDFSSPTTFLLTPDQVLKSISIHDSSVVSTFDENGEQKMEPVVTNRYLLGSDIKGYLLKEDWVMNNYTGKNEKHIVSIAPLVYNGKLEKVIPLFWLYYPEWKTLLSCFEAKNFYSYEIISFSNVFEHRYFISRITKANNTFDRTLKATHHGDDPTLESELLKEKINTAENDLFQY